MIDRGVTHEPAAQELADATSHPPFLYELTPAAARKVLDDLQAGTHDRLVREVAVGVDAAIVFVEYDRSPEARYPVAIEQGYAAAQWVGREGAAHGIDRLAASGRSRTSCVRRFHQRSPSTRPTCCGMRVRRTQATRAAVAPAVAVLRDAFLGA